eukprot:GHVT01045766.1.p1 GENE.GHVT01045766.1~~GHVT01045766.1.p1  ORF type:complete len:604 (-),score=113.62 GHVT01045766.1:552-2285(-)
MAANGEASQVGAASPGASSSSSSPSASCEVAKSIAVDRMLVLDFGSQYSHLIVRRFRECGIYSELRSCDSDVETLRAFAPLGIVLSGGPSATYADAAPHVCPEFWDFVSTGGPGGARIPLLGICYGMQEIVHQLGGQVAPATDHREYGIANLTLVHPPPPKGNEPNLPHEADALFGPVGENDVRDVLMSHGDKVVKLPPGFHVIGTTPSSEFAAACDPSRLMWVLQFHPEVTHTSCGLVVLRQFGSVICGAKASWVMDRFRQAEVGRLKEVIGDRHVLGAVSGGVDSTVAACLVHQAIGKQFTAVLIDTGLLRENEAVEVMDRLRHLLPGINVRCLDASAKFFGALQGLHEPEAKRRAIGEAFVRCFEQFVDELKIKKSDTLLLQGTLYPDVIESTSYKGPSHTIKTHHNVGGLPERMHLKVLEPLRELFKDEVRQLGLALGLPHEAVFRHPFPGPGLAIRILGEVTPDRVKSLQEADKIFIDEIKGANLYDQIGQAFVVLLPDARSVGVMGDQRTYEMTAVLRAVETTDFMTADWFKKFPNELLSTISNRIINEVKGINRVCLDISSKPPATIEWE